MASFRQRAEAATKPLANPRNNEGMERFSVPFLSAGESKLCWRCNGAIHAARDIFFRRSDRILGEFQNETDENVLPVGHPYLCRERVRARWSKADTACRFTCAASASFTRGSSNFRFAGGPPGEHL